MTKAPEMSTLLEKCILSAEVRLFHSISNLVKKHSYEKSILLGAHLLLQNVSQ